MMTNSAPLVSMRVLILGVGETGAAAARWCARQGLALRVADTRAQPPGMDTLRADLHDADAQYALGDDAFTGELIEGIGQIVLSPGLVPTDSPVCDVLDAARAAGIEIVGEIELFARALTQLNEQQAYSPQVLAVTGTNGKTTVTALTRHMVASSGLTAVAAGNIGPAALTALMHAIDTESLPQVWVIELSSFQLETTSTLSPDAAVVLNVTQDHLDWHGSEAAYAAAKSRIYARARVKVGNRGDTQVLPMVGDVQSLQVRTFGTDVPTLVGDLGIEVVSGVTWLCACLSNELDDEAPAPRRKKNAPEPVRQAGRLSRLMPVDALRLRGMHNASNVLAALALARVLNLGWGGLLRAAGEYEGEPHRTQFVRSIGGVDFVNDSKGTNVGASVAALQGMGQPVVLIAGGLGKGQDFTPLAQAVAQYARAVVLMGQDAALIKQALAAVEVSVEQVDSLDAAVARALDHAQEGDAVVLSPACASMDMFRNYGHRGQAFVEAVSDLALDRGEVA